MAAPVSPRPRRPVQLIAALILVVLAALLYGMTAAHLSPPGPRSSGGVTSPTGLTSIAFIVALLAVRFSGARSVVTVLLLFFTFMWLPPSIRALSGDEDYAMNPVSYVLIASVLTVVGVLLLFSHPSNQYYALARERRQESKIRRKSNRRAEERPQA